MKNIIILGASVNISKHVIHTALSEITFEGERYPEELGKRTGL